MRKTSVFVAWVC
jgi:hypothetical protein